MSRRSVVILLTVVVGAFAGLHVATTHRAYEERLALLKRIERIERKPLIHAVFSVPDRKAAESILPALHDFGAKDITTWEPE